MIGSDVSGAFLGRCANVRRRLLMIFSMMVPVDLEQRFDAHAEIASGFPWIRPRLHQPRRRRVAKCVSSNRIIEPGFASGAVPTLAYRLHRLVVPFNEETTRYAKANPSAYVSEKARRQRRGRL